MKILEDEHFKHLKALRFVDSDDVRLTILNKKDFWRFKMLNDEFEIAVGELDVESPAGVLDIDDSMQTDDDDYDLSSALDPLLQLMPDNTRALVDLSLRNSGIGPDDPVCGMIIAQTIAIDCVARDAVREAMDKIEIAAPDANYKFPIEEFEDQIRKTMVSQSVNFGEQIEKISTVIAKGAADYQRNLTEINLALQALKKSVDDLLRCWPLCRIINDSTFCKNSDW